MNLRFRIAVTGVLLSVGMRGGIPGPMGVLAKLQSADLDASTVAVQGTSSQVLTRLPAAAQNVSVMKPVVPLTESEKMDLWTQFVQKYGEDLQPQYSSEGLLIALRSEAQVQEASSGTILDQAALVNRSNAILAALKPLLGISQNGALKMSAVRIGPQSAQVFYQQTLEGITLVPGGNVRVDLSLQGQLYNVDSDYAPGLQPEGQFSLAEADLKFKAEQAMNAKVNVPEKIYWVMSPTVARAAYRMGSMGKEMILDAESGKVLGQKNRRRN